jgi:hypothetical protein
MRGLLAPLSPHEETAFRKVGFGDPAPLAPQHLRRLLQLDLIEWNGWRWALTATGQRRYVAMVSNEVSNPKDA